MNLSIIFLIVLGSFAFSYIMAHSKVLINISVKLGEKIYGLKQKSSEKSVIKFIINSTKNGKVLGPVTALGTMIFIKSLVLVPLGIFYISVVLIVIQGFLTGSLSRFLIEKRTLPRQFNWVVISQFGSQAFTASVGLFIAQFISDYSTIGQVLFEYKALLGLCIVLSLIFSVITAIIEHRMIKQYGESLLS